MYGSFLCQTLGRVLLAKLPEPSIASIEKYGVEWSQDCQQTLVALKFMAYPKDDNFHLDASRSFIGAILSQVQNKQGKNVLQSPNPLNTTINFFMVGNSL